MLTKLKLTRNQTWNHLKDYILVRLWEQARTQIKYAIKAKVENQVWSMTVSQINHRIKECLLN